MKRLTLLFIATLFCIQTVAAQSNTAADDQFIISSDSILTIPRSVLLENDDIVLSDSFQLQFLTPPTNGLFALGIDGTVSYQPNMGFAGTDSFTYVIETLPEQILPVDTTSSEIFVDMTLQVIASTSQDTTRAQLSGETRFWLLPFDSPFSEAQIREMQVVVDDSLDLEFPFGGNLNIFARADTNSFALNLLTPGPSSNVTDDAFVQPDNLVNLTGAVNLTGTGLFETLLPDSTITFDAEDDVSLSATLDQDQDSLSLDISFSVIDTLDLGTAIVFLDVAGNVRSAGIMNRPVQSNVATVIITVEPSVITSVEDEQPVKFALGQNYPNPFNPVTTISFSLPSAEHTTLAVFDLLGRNVRTLVDGVLASGAHQVQLQANDLPSGIYFYRLTTPNNTATRRLTLVK